MSVQGVYVYDGSTSTVYIFLCYVRTLWLKNLIETFLLVSCSNITHRTEKMAAVHFTTIPCEPNTANSNIKSQMFCINLPLS